MEDITEGGKYYEPSADEFHLGFEIELYNGGGQWSKFVFDKKYDQDGNAFLTYRKRTGQNTLTSKILLRLGS